MDIVDTHCHMLSDDLDRYPRAPIGGTQSGWATTRPVTAEGMFERIAEAGIARSVLVQATTAYGYDNTYVLEQRGPVAGAVRRRGHRRPAPTRRRRQPGRGRAGRRTGRRAPVHHRQHGPHPRRVVRRTRDRALLGQGHRARRDRLPADAPRSGHRAGARPAPPVPRRARTARPHGLSRRRGLPAAAGKEVAALAVHPALHLKLTHRTLEPLQAVGTEAAAFLDPVLSAFVADRIAWGSNLPAAEQSLPDLVILAQDVLAELSDTERQEIFAGTARRLYPGLTR